MTFAFWMILVAAMLPYMSVGLAKFGGPGYDNAAPRPFLARLGGWRARAEWAHRNHFEAFAPFAAAVLVAHAAGAPPRPVDWLAAAFIVARAGYTAAYLADWPTARSAMWAIGLACVILLFCAGLL